MPRKKAGRERADARPKQSSKKRPAESRPNAAPQHGPSSHAARDNYRPSPPRRAAPPDMYQFRGQSARDSDRQGDGFSFNMPGPRFEPAPYDNSRSHRPRSPPRGPRRDGRRNAPNGYQGHRGGWQKRGASDRVILRSKRDTTPERLEGMGGGTSFRAIEDLSDSEADMELSDNDAATDTGTGDADAEGRPAKRTRVEKPVPADVPRWSNPDPYTALPPPDESQTKKKDMVQLIRKAKIAAEEAAASESAAEANVDFISLNFDAESEDGDEAEEPQAASLAAKRTANITSATEQRPDKFSHLNNLYPDRGRLPPKPLADRIERPGPRTDGTDSVRIPLPNKPPAKQHGRYSELEEVNLDRWPPPDKNTAVAGSKRSLGLDYGDSPPPLPHSSAPGRMPHGPPAGKKRKRLGPLDGSVTEDWLAAPGVDRTPWCTADHSDSKSMGNWLHKEVRDFYDYVRPYHFEEEVRSDLISRISRALDSVERGGKLFSFGSYAAGIYLPTADLDLVFVSQSFLDGGYPLFCKNKKWMFRTLSQLTRHGVARPDGEVIWGAKVPILKITDPVTNLRVDISFENMTGVIANQTFRDWKDEFAAMPILVTLVKQFLLMRGLNEVHTGGIGGFTVTCLVTSLLQHLPAMQSGNMRAEEHLGEILMEFLDLYGNKFDYRTTGIEMSPPGYIRKPDSAKVDRLCVIDPNRRDNNISGGSHKVTLVFDAFQEAYSALQRRMAYLERCSVGEKRDASILDCILGGNYSMFRNQRDHLKRLWDRDGRRPQTADTRRRSGRAPSPTSSARGAPSAPRSSGRRLPDASASLIDHGRRQPRRGPPPWASGPVAAAAHARDGDVDTARCAPRPASSPTHRPRPRTGKQQPRGATADAPIEIDRGRPGERGLF